MRRGAGAPGKDGAGDKVIGPLFPRLHVNDSTLKGGGPRAPPRNKMALYEQFSVPSSQRFNAPNAAVSSASAGQISPLCSFQPYVLVVYGDYDRCQMVDEPFKDIEM